jgi:integrase
VAELDAWLNAHDVAPSTQRQYDGRVRTYEQFCRDAALPQAVTPLAVAAFIKARVDFGVRLSTIEGDVAALSREARSQGWDLSGEPMIKQALKCASRLAGVGGPHQKLPLLAEHMRRLLRQVAQRTDTFLRARDTALFTIGWAGMFRVSELVGLRWEHIQSFPTGVMMLIPTSKTDQSGQGSYVFISRTAAVGCGAGIDPVTALEALAAVQGHPAAGPVFTARPQGSGALSKTTVGVRLREYIQAAGIQRPDLYACHSLRRGGATEAARMDLALRHIQLMGRWRSDAVRQYLYSSPSEAWQLSARLLQA